MIEVRNLTKSFGDKVVLDNINVTFETGKTNLIIGQSGSGKTVLMKNPVCRLLLEKKLLLSLLLYHLCSLDTSASSDV